MNKSLDIILNTIIGLLLIVNVGFVGVNVVMWGYANYREYAECSTPVKSSLLLEK